MARPNTPSATVAASGRPLDQQELAVLRQDLEVLGGREVRIARELPRDLYERIKLLLERLGGVYVPGRRRFAFALDPVPLLHQVLALGTMPRENPLDFYFSPQEVVEAVLRELAWGDTMADLLWLQEQQGARVRALEPSAGLGHLADAFRARYPTVPLDVIELDPYRRAVLEAKGHRVVASDCLQYRPPPGVRYAIVLMNPPFTVGGDSLTFVRHIRHAASLLEERAFPESKLVSVVPAQLAHAARYREFYQHVLQYGSYEDLPGGAFTEASTAWQTGLISLGTRKNHFYATWDESDPEDPGYPNRRLKVAWMYISVDEVLSNAHARLMDDLLEGRLVVYRDGAFSPPAVERLRAFCHQVTARLLSEYATHLPLSQDDLACMERHILADYRLGRAQYAERKRREWERARERRLGSLRDEIARLTEQLAREEARQRQRAALLERRKGEMLALEQETSPTAFAPTTEPPSPGTVIQKARRSSPYRQESLF